MAIDDYLEAVEGNSSNHDIVLLALSTCGHCRNAKKFLDENSLAYRFVYVDLQEGNARKEVIEEASKLNPKMSFPVLLIDSDDVILGFNEDSYKEKLL